MLQNLQNNRLWEYLRRKRMGNPYDAGNQRKPSDSFERYTSPGYRVGIPYNKSQFGGQSYTNPQATQAPWAQRQAAPYQQQSMQQPYQQSQFGMSQYLNREGAARAGNPTQSPVSNVDNTTMRGDNLGGENLPPLDRNPYSPTQGQGFNLKNMLRKNRPTYY